MRMLCLCTDIDIWLIPTKLHHVMMTTAMFHRTERGGLLSYEFKIPQLFQTRQKSFINIHSSVSDHFSV